MRLLHTSTLNFGEFFDARVPEHCILSHRWGTDEFQYYDVRDRCWDRDSEGYWKIRGACRVASRRGFNWIWIDTCCINKDSSAELTEAINSMFTYYFNSKLCIAYLSDVRKSSGYNARDSLILPKEAFHKSAWFTRGWTLQELLARTHLDFFDRSFKYIGSKRTMSDIVSDVTGIAQRYLTGRTKLNEASIATRMSWASERETTRLEDQAYSLLGIFGVNMPLLYGEGKMAFLRLQQQILENSDDESLFAWICQDAKDDQPFGMLAESPRNFRHSHSIRQTRPEGDDRPPCVWTSRGLALSQGRLDTVYHVEYEGKVAIACTRESSSCHGPLHKTVAVRLRKVKGAWYRFFSSKFHYTSKPFYPEHFQTFYVAQPNLITTPRLFRDGHGDLAAMVRDQVERDRLKAARDQRIARLKWVVPIALPVVFGVIHKVKEELTPEVRSEIRHILQQRFLRATTSDRQQFEDEASDRQTAEFDDDDKRRQIYS